MFVQCMYPLYCVLFSPLWLKTEPGWQAISVSTSQLFRVGQIVWFGWLSAISQLACGEEGWGVGQLSASIALHSLTLPGPGGNSREGGCIPSPWSEAQNPIPPPPLTHCISVYREGREGGELNQREG
jgi:hypothetical protein